MVAQLHGVSNQLDLEYCVSSVSLFNGISPAHLQLLKKTSAGKYQKTASPTFVALCNWFFFS